MIAEPRERQDVCSLGGEFLDDAGQIVGHEDVRAKGDGTKLVADGARRTRAVGQREDREPVKGGDVPDSVDLLTV